MTPAFDIRIDLKPLHKAMVALGARQVPFATALTLNALAKGVVAVEQAEVDRTFDTPTPFTQKAFRTEVATKAKPVARVAVKDIQSDYLRPYVIGGARSLGTKKGMLAPITGNVKLNAHGNLTKGKLKSLAAKPNVYIGPIVTRGGKRISGVWQRPSPKRGKAAKGPLKLLIKFSDTTPVKKRFDFYGVGQRYVRANAASEFTAALRRAMATQRP